MRTHYFRCGLLLTVAVFVLSGCSVPAPIAKFLPFLGQPAPEIVPLESQLPSASSEISTAPASTADPVVVTTTPAVVTETPVINQEPMPLDKVSAFKGVVKIKTLTLDIDGSLVDSAEGSGVVVSQDGFILTNSHVVTIEDDLDKSDKPAVFGICFTADMNQEPDCSQTAELVTKDKDLDIALLRLNGNGILPFLKLAASSTASTSEEVFALGYPGIGQDTITMTKGIVSGKLDKYGKKWIKTDAVISFGSSGGAAIDSKGEVLGITTAGYSDTLGELGYIIDSASIIDWIKTAEDTYKPAAVNPLTDRALKFMAKQKELKTALVFSNTYPDVSITHPDGWDFRYYGENVLSVFSKKEEDKSGTVEFDFVHHAYLLSEADIDPILKQKMNSANALTMIKITKEQAVDINGLKGRKISISMAGKMENFYMFPWREYMIEVSYSYGDNDKDKAAIDGIINSLKAGQNASPFNEVFAFHSSDPVFGLNSIKGWPLMEQNEKTRPLAIESKSIKGAYVTISLTQKTDEIKGLTNEDLLANMAQMNEQVNQVGGMMDFQNKIISQNAKYKINDEFKSAIKLETNKIKISSKEVLAQVLEYSISLNDKYILTASLDVLGKDKKVYASAVADFNKIIASLTLSPKIDSDNDGLSDEAEAKLGTDPQKADTDGDGYFDGSEVVNGYNPLAK